MQNQECAGCDKCAYVLRKSDGMWCPFHDEPVSSQLVCDDYLDPINTPIVAAALEDPQEQNFQKQYTSSDILTYCLLALCIIVSICFTFYY